VRIHVDDADLDVLDEGAGTPIVLLHAFGLAKETWDEHAALLSLSARVLRPDLRGLGASRGGPGPYLMESLASDVAAVLDARNIERAVVVGNGLGAFVALAFYRMFEERVLALGLCAARAAGDAPDAAAARLALAERVEHEGMDVAVETLLPRYFARATYARDPDLVARTRDVMRANDARGAAAVLRGMAARVDASDLFADMRCPVLVAAGVDDLIVPLAEQEAMRSAIPAARLAKLAGGHLAPLEAPVPFTEAVSALAGEAATAGRR
jgi:pimeloyl-ACP methyl ester carboxylesterase